MARWNRDELLDYLQLREREGLSWRELSELSEIPISTLQYWHRRIRDEAGAGLIEVPVRVTEGRGSFVIEVGHCRVHVANGFDAAELRRLVDTLAC